MPRGSWLGLVVAVSAAGQGLAVPYPRYPPGPPPDWPAASSLPHAEDSLRDLTPPGFGDLVPPPDPHRHPETPGHLTPTVPPHAGFYGTAEYLLFRPRSGGFDFATVNGTGLAVAGPVESLKYDLGSGLRVEGGYRFGPGWDGGFAYTYFRADGDRVVSAGPGGALLPTLTRPGLTDSVSSATAVADLTYNLYDIVLGKRVAVDDHLAVRGLAGFRLADIRQRFDVRFDGLDAVAAAASNRSRFEGFGPVVGAEGVLAGWRGLHAYARATGGLLTGRSVNTVRETNNGGGTVYVDGRYGVRKVVPVAAVAVGAGWQYRTVSVRAGYEITHWWGLTEPARLTDTVAPGKLVTRPADLSLEGFFVQVGVAF